MDGGLNKFKQASGFLSGNFCDVYKMEKSWGNVIHIVIWGFMPLENEMRKSALKYSWIFYGELKS